MMPDHINVKGYTTPREFSGFQIPIPLQSTAIRRYCEERGFVFNHHVAENINQGTFLVLERIVAESDLFRALAMCSIGMLPDDQEYRIDLLERCVRTGLVVHFVFEQLVVRNRKDISMVNELLSLSRLLKNDLGRVSMIQNLIFAR